MPFNPYMTPPVLSRSANAAIAVATLEPRAAARAKIDVNPEITSKVHALTLQYQQRISSIVPLLNVLCEAQRSFRLLKPEIGAIPQLMMHHRCCSSCRQTSCRCWSHCCERLQSWAARGLDYAKLPSR